MLQGTQMLNHEHLKPKPQKAIRFIFFGAGGPEVVNLPGVTGLKSSVIPKTCIANHSSKKKFFSWL